MMSFVFSGRFWLVTGAALVVAATTFSLGQWQMGRAAQKQALQAAISLQAGQPVLDNAALYAVKNVVDAVHRPVQIRGVWQAAHTVFLDNRTMGGKTGFYVLTPLAIEGSAQVVLVQRGWVPRNFTTRTQLPDVPTPSGTVVVGGRIAPPPSKLYEFKGTESGRIRQNIAIDQFAIETALALLPVSLLQTGPSDEGLSRDWAVPNFGVDKHYGYAFQWFALCALVVGLYAWFQIINPIRLKNRAIPRSSF